MSMLMPYISRTCIDSAQCTGAIGQYLVMGSILQSALCYLVAPLGPLLHMMRLLSLGRILAWRMVRGDGLLLTLLSILGKRAHKRAAPTKSFMWIQDGQETHFSGAHITHFLPLL